MKNEIMAQLFIRQKNGGLRLNQHRNNTKYLEEHFSQYNILELLNLFPDNNSALKTIVSGYNSPQYCVVCQVNQVNIRSKYINGSFLSPYCSSACANSATSKQRVLTQKQLAQSIRKRKATKLERYGDENYVNSAKGRTTCNERSDGAKAEILRKRKATKLERYGDENYVNSAKGHATFANKSDDEKEQIKAKVKATKLERYGDENYCNSKKIKEMHLKKSDEEKAEILRKRKATKLERYGDENYCNSNKKKSTYLSKYGRIHFSQKHIPAASIEIMKSKESAKKFIIENNITSVSHLCQRLGYISVSHMRASLKKINLIHLFPKQTSDPETSLRAFVESLNVKFTKNDRALISPYELDICVPSKKVAIEMNGVYWHSEQMGKGKNYHLNKTESCEKLGFSLLQIFDSEWMNETKREIWKSVIRHKLGLTKSKIYARKCEVREISAAESDRFVDKNHIQGKAISSVRLGLFHNNELVSVMTFGQCRFSKKATWELIRFCSLLNTSVVGGFSKLMTHFKRHETGSILSYGNRRWSTGSSSIYGHYGKFSFEGNSKPNYFYTLDYKTLFSRQIFQKHKLKTKLKVFDEEKTEWENMIANGYDRIWDAGNAVFVFSELS